MVTGTKFSQIPLSSTNPVSTSTFVAFDSANPSTDVRYTLAELQNVIPRIFANSQNLYVRTPPVVCTISSTNPTLVTTQNGTAGQPGTGTLAHGLSVNGQVAFSIIRTWFTCSVDTSGTNLFTASAAHGFNVNDPVQLIADIAGGSYATGFSTNTTYFVIVSGLDATHFRLSATVGGASLTIGGTQTGQLYYYRAGNVPSPIIEGFSGYFVVSTPSPSTFTFSTTLGGPPVSTLGHAQAGYFVVQTGNNNNDGSAATSTNAFMDIQRSADLISDSYTNGGLNFEFPVVVNVSAGTYFESVGLGTLQGSLGPDSFGVEALIVGSTDAIAHPENYRVDGGGSPAFRLGGSSNWFISGFQLMSSFGGTNGPAGLVTCQFDGIAQCSSIYWGLNNPGGWAVSSTNDDNSNGRIFCIGTHRVVDVQANGMIKCDKDSWVEFSHGNFYMMVPISWGTAFAEISRGAFLFLRADDMVWHNSGSLFFSGDTLFIAGYGRGVSTNGLGNFPGDGKAHFSDQTGWFYDGTRSWQVGSPSYTFASLPNLPVEGMLYTVSDSNAAAGPITAGGGTNHVLAVYLASTNQWYALSTASGSTTPGTPVNSIQYDNAGVFGGIPKFAYDSTTGNETILDNGTASKFGNYYQMGVTGTDTLYCAAGLDGTGGVHAPSVYLGTSAANLTGATRSIVIGPGATLNGSAANSVLIGHEFNFNPFANQVTISMAGQTTPSMWIANSNVSVGGASGNYTAVTGTGNVTIGASCMPAVTSGTNNVAIGNAAGTNSTTAIDNVMIGVGAGAGITAETAIVAIGTNVLGSAHAAFNGSQEVYIGYQAGLTVVNSGGVNLGIGSAVLANVNGGSSNFAAGHVALAAALSGNNNMAVGPQSLQSLTTGSGNCAIGINSLSIATSAASNIGIGTSAGTTVVAGAHNVIIGSSAVSAGGDVGDVVAIGSSAFAAVTGSQNIGIGSSAGSHLTSGTGNILIGFGCDPPSLNTGSNNTLIGCNINNASTSLGSLNPTKLVAIADGSGAVQIYVNGNQTFQNIGIGLSAGNLTTTSGQGNNCIGSFCGIALTSGQFNALYGVDAGRSMTTGNNNTCLGVLSGFGLTTGGTNTLIGAFDSVGSHSAGSSITTGSFNTIVGTYPGTAAMASQVILSDGQNNIAVQYDMPNKVYADMTTTVGALPAAGTAGRRAFVTNSSQTMAANVGATVTSGGANVLPVYDDGVTWKIG